MREELEVARQEAAQALDCLCAEREGRAQDALQLKDAVPLSKHREALSAVSEQLAQTLQELQEEKILRGQAEEQAVALETQLQALQDAVPKEEHEKIKVTKGVLRLYYRKWKLRHKLLEIWLPGSHNELQ